jgi:hypothetical protein
MLCWFVLASPPTPLLPAFFAWSPRWVWVCLCLHRFVMVGATLQDVTAQLVGAARAVLDSLAHATAFSEQSTSANAEPLALRVRRLEATLSLCEVAIGANQKGTDAANQPAGRLYTSQRGRQSPPIREPRLQPDWPGERAQLLRRISQLERQLSDAEARSPPTPPNAETPVVIEPIPAAKRAAVESGLGVGPPADPTALCAAASHTASASRSSLVQWEDEEAWEPAQTVFARVPLFLPADASAGCGPRRAASTACRASSPVIGVRCRGASSPSSPPRTSAPPPPSSPPSSHKASRAVRVQPQPVPSPPPPTPPAPLFPLQAPPPTLPAPEHAPAGAIDDAPPLTTAPPRAAADLLTVAPPVKSRRPSTESEGVAVTDGIESLGADRYTGTPPEGWASAFIRHSAFGSVGALPFGVGGYLSDSSVSVMQEDLRAKVHSASSFLAELAAVSASPDAIPVDPRGRLIGYLALRYLSSLCSLFVSLCSLPPCPEHLPLFRELAHFVAPPSRSTTARPGRDSNESGGYEEGGGRGGGGGRDPFCVAARTSLLGEINDAARAISEHATNESELLETLRRAVALLHAELTGTAARGGWGGTQHPPPTTQASATPTCGASSTSRAPTPLSRDLRMSGMRGGGGGSDLGKSGSSFAGELPWKRRHAIPHTPQRPAWLPRSESVPSLPHGTARAAGPLPDIRRTEAARPVAGRAPGSRRAVRPL